MKVSSIVTLSGLHRTVLHVRGEPAEDTDEDLGKSCQDLNDGATLGEINVPSFPVMSLRNSSAPYRCGLLVEDKTLTRLKTAPSCDETVYRLASAAPFAQNVA